MQVLFYKLFMRITPEIINRLEENEIFVFGSNKSGFHGAGAAGKAFRNDSRNNWREDNLVLHSIRMLKDENRHMTGMWAVWGIAEGLMQGGCAKSYAIPTVTKPGHRRSIPLEDIKTSIDSMLNLASTMPDYKFYVTKIGTQYAGYTVPEIAELFRDSGDLLNVYLPQEFHDYLINNKISYGQ